MRRQSRPIGLALLLMVLGAPAREAEAASDLARTRAEIGTSSRFEETDGGVGDDQLEALCSDSSADQVAATLQDQGRVEVPAGIVAGAGLPPLIAGTRVDAPPRPPSSGLAVRLAILQRFRF